MKKFLMFLMCAAAFTFAQTEEETEYQEEESTQVEQAEEAGETSSVAQSEAVDYYAVDSLQVYNDLVEKFERRGNKIRRPGNPLIIAGSIALGVGIVTMIVGEAAVETSCDYESCDDDAVAGAGLYILGDVLATAGVLSLATGITLKIVGGTQLKRARMYRKKAEDYAARKDAAFLHVVPTIDPINGRVGTLALLDF